GIGRRLDGWANRDLDVGKIVSLAPNLAPVAGLLGTDEATVRQVLTSWGPGKFDAELFLDGKAVAPGGTPGATLIPPAFGLAGVNAHTWTGSWGNVTYWNAFVANLEMHGKGTFFDPRLDDPAQFPVAAAAVPGPSRPPPPPARPRLPPPRVPHLPTRPPPPPQGGSDERAPARGEGVFAGKARCASCHVPPLYTEPGWNLHAASEIGV